MKWLLLLPFQLLCMILGYLTDWFVVFFANEVGELPRFLKYWQTWDSTLDNKEYVEKNCFSWCRYNYSEYYEETKILLPEYNRDKRIAIQKKELPWKDKIKRYFCRMCWLYRNNAYGFAFYWFGINTVGNEIVYLIDIDRNSSNRTYLAYEKGHSIWITPWVFSCSARINSWCEWNTYIGWKMNQEPKSQRSMIAHRIAIDFDDF